MSEWKVVDHDNDNTQVAESRSKAEDMKHTAESMGSENVEIIPPETESDGGVEVVHEDPAEPPKADSDQLEDVDQLPDKPRLDANPLEWMPGSFTDNIEGQDVINRQGYEIMARYYDIGTKSNCVVGPEETEFQFARVQATATTDDGTEYQAHGSAHVERGDDKELLLEMADTRARKRALAQATGTGMLAVEELKNEL